MDQRTRKLMTKHKVLHPRDRLYVSSKARVRGLGNIEDSVDTSITRLADYVKNSKERLITEIWNDPNNTGINRATITRKQKWEEKQLYGYFKWQTSEISYEKIWAWLRKGNLLRQLESLLTRAQNNAIWSNYVKAKIHKTQQNGVLSFRTEWKTIGQLCCQKLTRSGIIMTNKIYK